MSPRDTLSSRASERIGFVTQPLEGIDRSFSVSQIHTRSLPGIFQHRSHAMSSEFCSASVGRCGTEMECGQAQHLENSKPRRSKVWSSVPSWSAMLTDVDCDLFLIALARQLGKVTQIQLSGELTSPYLQSPYQTLYKAGLSRPCTSFGHVHMVPLYTAPFGVRTDA